MGDHRMCGITDPHLAHAFTDGEGQMQLLYSCPGVPHRPAGEVAPGPCWDDPGVTWPSGASPRCELRAGHAGAHECDRGELGGIAVWPNEPAPTLPERERGDER